MRCKKCGSEISRNQKFCGVCGAPMTKRRWPLVIGGVLGVALVAAGVTVVLALTGALRLDGLFGDESDPIGYVDGDFVQLAPGFTDVKVTDEDSALEALDDVAPALEIEDTEDQLEPAESSNALDTVYYRYSQTYEGIPVYGRGITVGADENGEAVLLTSNYLPLDGVEIETEPDITEDEALEAVRQEESDAQATSCGLCIYSLNETDPVLAWQVATTRGSAPVRLFVNALDGSVVSESVLGATDTLFGKGKNGEDLSFEADTLNGKVFTLQDDELHVQGYDAGKKSVAYSASAGSDDSGNTYDVLEGPTFVESDGTRWSATADGNQYRLTHGEDHRVGYISEIEVKFGEGAKDPSDPVVGGRDELFKERLAATTAYAHACTTLKLYQDVLRSNGFDNAGGEVHVIANVDKTEPRNAYSPSNSPHVATLEFGYKNAIEIETVAHEMTHSYQYVTGLKDCTGESGAIQEAVGDLFGEAVKDYRGDRELDGDCDWIHGDSRNLAEPLKSKSPEGSSYFSGAHPEEYEGEAWEDPKGAEDSGYIHNNSTVLSHAFYLMCKGDDLDGESLTLDQVLQIAYLTVQATPYSTTFKQYRIMFETLSSVLPQDTQLTDKQITRVRAAFDKVKIPSSSSQEIRAEKKRMKLQLGDHFNGMGDDIDVDLDDSYGQEISDVLKELAEQYGVVETGADTYAGLNGSGIKQLVPSERLDGLLTASVDDYDSDSEDELLVIRSDLEAGWWTSSTRGGTEGPLEIEMYERESSGYELADSEEVVVGGLADNYPVASVQLFVGEYDGDPALYVDYSANFNDQWTTTLGFTYDGAFEQIGGWAVYEHYNSVRCYESEGSDAQANLRVDDSAQSGWRKAYELSWGEGAAPEGSFFDEYREQYVSALDAIDLDDKYPRSYVLTENAPTDESYWMCSIGPSEHFSVSGGGDVAELCGVLSLFGGSGNGVELTCYDRTGLLDPYRTGSAQTGSESGSDSGDNNGHADRGGFTAKVVEETVTFASHSYARQSPGPDTARTWSYPQFSGGESSEALEDLNKRIKDEFDEMVEDARAWTSSDASMYTEEYNVDITYCKDGIASVREERYEYGGGAHGMSMVTGSTYDLLTGEEVSVEKALGDGESGLSLASAAETGLREFFTEHPEEYSAGDPSTASFDDIVNDPDRYYITDDGVVFVTRPYEFGPYGNGWHEILITSFKTADLLYQDVRESYE